MSFDPTQSEWENRNAASVNAAGEFYEDTTDGIHAFTQDIQFRVSQQSIGTSGTLKARVKGGTRNVVWLSAQEDANVNTAWFDLASGTVLQTGSNVTSATIFPVAGLTGFFDIKIVFSGTLPQSILRFTLGASTGAGVQKYAGVNNDLAFTCTRAQFFAGTVEQDYVETTTLETYEDLQTSDGSQDIDFSSLTQTQWPNNAQVNHISGRGAEQNALSFPDTAYDRDSFTIMCLCDWDGNSTAANSYVYHGTTAGSHAALHIDAVDGYFRVRLSNNGTAWQKEYIAVSQMTPDEKTLLTASWDGTDLQMYYNDIELTVASGELTKTTDDTLSGDIFDSTESGKVMENVPGKMYEFRLYSGRCYSVGSAGRGGLVWRVWYSYR